MVKAMTLFKLVFPNSYAKLRRGDGLFVDCGLHRNAPQPPVAAPSNEPVGSTKNPTSCPSPQVRNRTPATLTSGVTRCETR